jgi:dihydroceramidase
MLGASWYILGKLSRMKNLLYFTQTILRLRSIEVYSQSRFGSPLILFLLGYSAFVTYSYLIINDPVFHQVAYAILVITIVFRSVYLVKHLPPQTTNERPHLVRLLRLAAAGFIISFAVWNVDNQFCSYFRHARTLVPYAVGALTQLHGWWHIGTSLGVFYFTVFLEWMQLIVDEKNTQQYELVWVGGIICYLRPLDKSHKA